MNDLPPSTHNNPPEPLPYDETVLADIRARAKQFSATAGDWLDAGKIPDEEQAQLAADFITGLRKLKKEAEAAQKAAKAPWAAKADIAYAAYKPSIEALQRGIDKVAKLQADYLREKQAELDRQKAAERAEAQRKTAEAEAALAAATARNDVMGQTEAEAALKAAEKETKVAAKDVRATVASATGGGRAMGLRQTRCAVVRNINALFLHYRDAPEVLACLETLANRDYRAAAWNGEEIPGTTFLMREGV